MSIACEVTREEKVEIWKIFRDLTRYQSYTTQHESEHSSYANLYVNNWNELGQTSHTFESAAGKLYFKWVSVNEFKRLLTNTLIEKRKIKL